jgi:hypothetical protein
MSIRLGWNPYYQDDVLEILQHSYENTFRITSTKYLVFIRNNVYLTIYTAKNSISSSDRLYTNESSSLSFQDFFEAQIDLYSEMKFNKIIDRILSMKAFS